MSCVIIVVLIRSSEEKDDSSRWEASSVSEEMVGNVTSVSRRLRANEPGGGSKPSSKPKKNEGFRAVFERSSGRDAITNCWSQGSCDDDSKISSRRPGSLEADVLVVRRKRDNHFDSLAVTVTLGGDGRGGGIVSDLSVSPSGHTTKAHSSFS